MPIFESSKIRRAIYAAAKRNASLSKKVRPRRQARPKVTYKKRPPKKFGKLKKKKKK